METETNETKEVDEEEELEDDEEEDVEIVLDDAGDLEAALEGEDKRDAIQLKPKEQPQTVAADEGEEKPPMEEVIPLRAGEININGIGEFNGQQILDVDLDDGEKPWRKPGADITDYFNYGFNEKTWRAYCLKQKQMREDMKKFGGAEDMKSSGDGGGSFQRHSSTFDRQQPQQQSYQQDRQQEDDYRRHRGNGGGSRWRDDHRGDSREQRDRGSADGGRQTPSDYGGERSDRREYKRYRDSSIDSGGGGGGGASHDRSSSHRYKSRRMQ